MLIDKSWWTRAIISDWNETKCFPSICSLSEREKTAVEKLKHDALEMVEPYIKDDERWKKIREFVV